MGQSADCFHSASFISQALSVAALQMRPVKFNLTAVNGSQRSKNQFDDAQIRKREPNRPAERPHSIKYGRDTLTLLERDG